MENARIIQVGNISSVTTFDDAFGDYSNASGRERRKKRRLERIEARREVKTARIAARDEAKRARQEARQGRKLARKQRRTEIAGERLAKRQQRVSARALRRGTKVGARLERRGQRTALRQQRRAVRRGEPELEMDETTTVENGVFDEGPVQPQEQVYQDQYQEEETPQGGGFLQEDEGYVEEPTDEGFEESQYEAQDQEDEDFGNEYEDEAGADGGDVLGFDGTGRVAIDEKLLDVTNKIEWNNELIDRLMDKVDEAYNMGRETANIEDVIDARKERVSQLEGELEDYVNADGLTPKEVTRRRRQVEKARGLSKRNREKATAKRVKMVYGGSETPVDVELNPEFSPNRIEVPAEIKSTMTGLNGIDNFNDYDAPDTRIVDLSSNFLGVDTKKINWGAIMAGIVIGGVAIYALKKYKVLDKI